MKNFKILILLSLIPFLSGASQSLEHDVMESILDSDYMGEYFYGDDGEDCFDDYQVETWKEEQNLISVEFKIYHLAKHGCYLHNTISCEATYDLAKKKVTGGWCEIR